MIGENSITWGDDVRDSYTCLMFPENGYYRRENEQSKLPHAIGCQSPMTVSDYQSILQGKTESFLTMSWVTHDIFIVDV